MQRLFLITLAVVVILATGFCVLIIVSLIPFFHVIGFAATAVVFVLLACIATLMVSFTLSRIGIWRHRARTIVAGEIVAYIQDGQIIHLSAEHEKAKVPLPAPVKELPPPSKKPEVDDETVLDLYNKHGVSLHSIAESTGISYHQVRKIVNAAKEKEG
jgi:hypothetical protein